MFKKGLFILMAALIVGALALSSCTSEPPNQTTPPSGIDAVKADVTDLQTGVTDLQTDIANLQTDVSAVKSTLAELETTEDYQAAIDALETLVSGVEASVSTINSKFSDYATKTELDAFNSQLDNVYGDVEALGVRVNEAETAIANVINSINTLEAEIDAIEIPEPGEVDLTEVYAYVDNEINEAIIALNLLIEETNSYILGVEQALNNLSTSVNNLDAKVGYVAEITRFVSGSSYLELTTRTAGDYIIVLHLYGTGLDQITGIGLLASQNVEVIFDNTYGAGSTMRVVGLQPKTVGTPPASPNWTNNKLVEVSFNGNTALFSVDYATISTGVR